MKQIRLFFVLGVALTLTACGVMAPSKNPGYADIDLPNGSGLQRDTSISIGPRMLHFVARHANEGPETRAMLEALDGVRVRVYEIEEDTRLSWLREHVNRSAEHLESESWKPAMRVVDEDTTLHVLIRQGDDESILGLALVSVDQEELVFVNVMGRLTPDVLLQIPATLADTEAENTDTGANERQSDA